MLASCATKMLKGKAGSMLGSLSHVVVCSECRRSSCWYGDAPCEKARAGRPTTLTRAEVAHLNLEDPRFWTAKYVEMNTGYHD